MIAEFINSLTNYTRATDSFEFGTQIYKKDNAIKKKFVSLNRLYKSYIVIDIDKPNATFLFEENNLPVPTIITINPKNGHCHYLYELRTPVIYTENARRRPQSFYEAIDCSLTKALGGDPAYIGRITKNPLHPAWKVLQHNVKYDLNDFQEYIDIRSTKEIQLVPGAGRNCTLFDTTRHWAYDQVRFHNLYFPFMNEVESKTSELNNRLFGNYEQGLLGYKEVFHIAKSIGNWTWRHRHTIGSKCNRGAMAGQFEPNTPLVVKQMLSAERTNEVRKETTLEKIIKSACILKSQGTPITQQSVAIHANVSMLSVKRNWESVDQQINLYRK